MSTIQTIDRNSAKTEEFSQFWLCYIDEIEKTFHDYTPEAKEYRKTEEWKEQDRLRDEKFHRNGFLSSDDPEFGYRANPILNRGAECQDYPNPEYIQKKQEYYAYFTNNSIEKQWGDDWDDAPYEYNAGTPYCEDGYKIIRVPFYVQRDGWNVALPEDWGGDNSRFCVRDINAGAVAWIYARGKDGKTSGNAVAIQAGTTSKEFLEKIDRINELYPCIEDD